MIQLVIAVPGNALGRRGGVRLNPLSCGVDGLRSALNGGFAFGVAAGFAVLDGLVAILLANGAWLFSKIEV